MAKDIKAQLEKLAKQLEAQLGENLSAFCLYGPAVRHDTHENERALSTLLILQDASASALRPIEGPISGWRKHGHPPPLIFSLAGWHASTDVFPIEIEDMREAHLLVRGEPPFEELTTTREDLRRELEREVRSKLLRLRTEFVAAAADRRRLEDLLVESAGTFFVLFRAVHRVLGERPPQERKELVRRTADVTGMDPDAFNWVLDKLGGKKVPRLVAYDAVGDRYLEQVEVLASWVDAYDGSPQASVSQE